MPKIKTHRGAAKRFHKTATGKYVRQHSHARHILTKKPRGRKRKLNQSAPVAKTDVARLGPMVPYL